MSRAEASRRLLSIALIVALTGRSISAGAQANSGTLTIQQQHHTSEHKLTTATTKTTTSHNNQLQADAPKLYHLNELLYKSADGDESPQAAALPAGPTRGNKMTMGPLRPRNLADDSSSSIEGLVKMMRGRERPDRDEPEAVDSGSGARRDSKGVRGPPTNGGRLEPDDEATIQRKTTNLDESAGLPEARGSSSRIRSSSRDYSNNIPRRRRRASVLQAPPKLKSRRVVRNSRRRKLRHGVKPRRRA